MCSSSCIGDSSTSARCATTCAAGALYCGWELEEKDYTVSASQGLYKCDSDGSGVTLSTSCTTSCEKGSPSQCKSAVCQPGSIYCGHQFIPMYWKVVAGTFENLYSCSDDGKVSYLATCSKCVASGSQSYCQCVPGTKYCGHEMISTLHWSTGPSNTSYQCDTTGINSVFVKSCKYGCDHGDTCKRAPCWSGYSYCGAELLALDWPAPVYSADAEYMCSSDTLSASYGELNGLRYTFT